LISELSMVVFGVLEISRGTYTYSTKGTISPLAKLSVTSVVDNSPCSERNAGRDDVTTGMCTVSRRSCIVIALETVENV
jgi:hypothetical protein